MDLSEFDFDLPDECIALRPADPRDTCKLLVKEGHQPIRDEIFRSLPNLLRAGDLLIANDTRVVPALLFGKRYARDEFSNDVDVQVNLLEESDAGIWRCLAKPGRRLRVGDQVVFTSDFSAEIVEKGFLGEISLRFSKSGDAFWQAIEATGAMPIPPYIAKQRQSDDADHQDYQTVFAKDGHSVAAPTAGLHFTDRLIEALDTAGVSLKYVTLHVGAGTFAPLSEKSVETGKLHSEWCSVSDDVSDAITTTKRNGGRVIAIGTTALRTLEARADGQNGVEPGSGNTDIFIRPGYEFQVIDGLITNFHLPKSSLFMLVSALMGTETMQNCYRHAIANSYGFYSYGDACLLMPGHD